MNDIIIGDCIDILKRAKREYIDLVLTDSPYNAGYDFDNDSMSRDEFLSFTRRWISEVVPTLKKTGVLCCFINEDYLFDFHAILKERLIFQRLVTWHFEPYPRCVDDTIDNRAEYILVFSRSDTFTFNVIREEPSSTTYDRWIEYVDEQGNIPYDSLTPSLKKRYKRENYERNPINIYRGSPQGNVIFCRRVKDNDEEAKYGRHPTQKPEPLLDKFVKMYTNVGDIVLDPFAGSGSTLVVAKKDRRRFVGVEASQEYAAVAKKRLADVNLTDRL